VPGQTSTMVLGTLGLAFIAVFVEPLWRWTRWVSTAVHEGGHATVALFTGHWVDKITIKPDRGGLTEWNSGTAFSTIPILTAGYTAPPAVGMILARVAERGWSPLNTLLAAFVVMVALLVFMRNWFGIAVVTLTGGVLAIFIYLAGVQSQRGAVVAFSWFLLFGGLRAAIHQFFARRRVGGSDADQLRDLTGIPADLWVLAFVAFAVFAVIIGGRLLLS
jgi:hypothetical protein